MMQLLRRAPLALLLAGALVLAGCDSTGSAGGGADATTDIRTVTDLPADPPQSTGSGRPTGTGRYTFFSLRDNEIVLRYSNPTRADSSSTQWDLAFQSVNVLVNGGTSGPGQGAAYVAEAAFQEVDQVDTDRLATDDADAGAFAIPQGSGNGWYNYNANGNNIVRPIAGRTIVVRTADGASYAKIRVQSYYEGAPDDPVDSDADSRYYTFDYVLSDDPSFE
jgi:hypothetical protein